MQEAKRVESTSLWSDLTARRRLIVGLWSVIIAGVSVAHFGAASATPLMPTRANGIVSSIDVLDKGGPPLLGSNVPYQPGIDSSHLYETGVSDDQGIYFYLPLLGHW